MLSKELNEDVNQSGLLVINTKHPLEFFRCVLASQYERLSVRRSERRFVRVSIGPSVTRFFPSTRKRGFSISASQPELAAI